ncbi:MAG: pantoate--beta-alanine ligase [Chromatiales bacterium]|nr:pantoate--beta-alanine ligase [Chromatiales bacterium]
METITQLAALRARLDTWHRAGEPVALVPTMGNLHRGHLSLVALARQHARRTVVTVFVNPTQFGPNEDFDAYPRTPAPDAGLLAATGADLLFMPAVDEVYPAGTAGATRVEVPGLSTILCGAHRPGHFAGVTSVVARLFHMTSPDVAIFGEKDFQQLAVIRRMVADLHFRVRIIGAPTVREPDGLALSSRNQYLTAAERSVAPQLQATLAACAADLKAGRRDFAVLEAEGMARLAAAGFRPDYVAIRSIGGLVEPSAGEAGLVVLAAAALGRARLIDNVLLPDLVA